MGLKVKLELTGIDKLKKHIDFVKKISLLKTDKKFQEYIQNKFLETVNQVSMERLPLGSLSLEYIEHNQIRKVENGFILYNDTAIETDTEGYGGKFSIALAFEYGTGIVGQDNPKLGAWQYNVKGHINGWWYPTDDSDPNPTKKITKDGLILAWTKGFEGYEIYRFTLERIKSKIKDWVSNYGNGGVAK
jgi:hypothetical protein